MKSVLVATVLRAVGPLDDEIARWRANSESRCKN
jgi:hypothetical protein